MQSFSAKRYENEAKKGNKTKKTAENGQFFKYRIELKASNA